ncbi:peritrophin-1-like [Scylla paramamosain]|uniref:peritrophin-1-like n=1 Tax=Scylla paramamosain TaxID=85552 RepID=UPI00308305AE
MKSLLLGVVLLALVSLVAAQTGSPCPAAVNAQCPAIGGGQAVFFAHPNDCSKYCECVQLGLAYELSCSTGLLWDDIRDTCNWPDYVDCGSRPKP